MNHIRRPRSTPSVAELPPIHIVRGQRVVLDSDLAALYGVPTFRLNEAVKRNADRFPEDFRFQLTLNEVANLKSQFAISSSDLLKRQSNPLNSSPTAMSSRQHGGRRRLPWAFTEHGALMAATVLNSPQAVQMSLYIVRAFVRLREVLLTNAVIFKRLAAIDKKLLEHDVVLQDVVEKLLPLLNPPPEEKPNRRIGFYPNTG
jgi:hypothetical protein